MQKQGNHGSGHSDLSGARTHDQVIAPCRSSADAHFVYGGHIQMTSFRPPKLYMKVGITQNTMYYVQYRGQLITSSGPPPRTPSQCPNSHATLSFKISPAHGLPYKRYIMSRTCQPGVYAAGMDKETTNQAGLPPKHLKTPRRSQDEMHPWSFGPCAVCFSAANVLRPSRAKEAAPARSAVPPRLSMSHCFPPTHTGR